MKFNFVVALALLIGGVAQASVCPETSDAQENTARAKYQQLANLASKVITIEGCDARMVLLSLERDESNTRSSTIGHTNIVTNTVECDLYGAHGGSPMSKDPYFMCSFAPEKK